MRIAIVRLSALASLAGFSVFFLTTEFAGLFAAMALMAFFWSAVLPLIEGLAFAHLGEQAHRYGSIRVWGSVGFIVAVLALGHSLDRLPIEAVLWVTASILAGIVLCSFIVPEAPRPPLQRDAASFGDTLRRPQVRALLGACFLMSAAHGALYVFYSIYLVDIGYDKGVVGWMWTLGVVAEIVVFMWMPRLTKRFSLRAILLFSFACAVARFLMIGWGAQAAWRCCCSPRFCTALPSAPTTRRRSRSSTNGFRAGCSRAARRSTAASPSARAACWAAC
jgi:PPP family 3-phenylpropionic acid transporter